MEGGGEHEREGIGERVKARGGNERRSARGGEMGFETKYCAFHTQELQKVWHDFHLFILNLLSVCCVLCV